VVAVSNYLFHAPQWVSFYLLPAAILVGFAFTAANEVRKMRRAGHTG